MKINYNEMEKLGLKFDDIADIIFYFSNMLDWLESHNKNYTKEQYNRILTLKEICDCLEV